MKEPSGHKIVKERQYKRNLKKNHRKERRDLGLTQPEWPKNSKEINGEERPDSPNRETDRNRQGIPAIRLFFTYM